MEENITQDVHWLVEEVLWDQKVVATVVLGNSVEVGLFGQLEGLVLDFESDVWEAFVLLVSALGLSGKSARVDPVEDNVVFLLKHLDNVPVIMRRRNHKTGARV